ncbi:MAG: ATP-binding protein [Gammaproteobacteria bacterium]|nr:ATP-binding protein [Gammaproteobacteria bacterium]
MYRSEIRESTINQLKDRVAKGNYRKYLREVMLKKVRRFEDVVIRFDFPVTAIIGPNGGGKSTVLGAAALAYRSVKPRRFFAKNQVFDTSMQGWRIRYSLIDRDVRKDDFIQRTASFRESRWKRSPLDRDVAIFGISRTVPASEQTQFLKFARSTYSITEQEVQSIGEEISEHAARILGWDMSRYKGVRHESQILFLGAERVGEDIQYSEFHFGAGEASIIRMIAILENLPEQSLVLIEEVENGLHPMAVLKMVEYLVELAERKRIQVIFTTHSSDALLPLPPEAIWAVLGDRAIQGDLDIYALRALRGYTDKPKAIVYTEDAFAKSWIESIVRRSEGVDLEMVAVYEMGGDGTAVKIHIYHNEDPASSVPSLCYIDGDSQQEASAERLIFRLPGEELPPEIYICDAVIDSLNEVKGKLAIALHQRFEKADEIAEIIRDVRQDTRDHHLLFAKIGERLGFIPEDIVREAFLFVWLEQYPQIANEIIEPIINIMKDN